jgi:uncharacterized protein with HEPN domain
MSSRRDRDYLQDICGAIERIQRYVGDLSRESLSKTKRRRMQSFATLK